MRLLIVDISPTIGLMAHESVEQFFEDKKEELYCSIALHADDAISLIKGAADPYDMVICNFVLDGMTGIDIVNVLKADHKHNKCKVVMMVDGDNHNGQNITGICDKEGIDTVVPKAFYLSQVFSSVVKKESDGDKTSAIGGEREDSPEPAHSSN